MFENKIGTIFTKQAPKYAQACGISSILQTKRVSLPDLKGIKYLPALSKDVAELSKEPFIKPIVISGTKNEWRAINELFVSKYKNASKKYKLYPKDLPKTEISDKQYEIIRYLQDESAEYRKYQRNARLGLQLDDADKKYYSDVCESMTKLNENQFVLRYLTPYENLETELKNGVLDFRGLTSCTTENTRFFMRWGRTAASEKEVGSNTEITLPYLVKVNLQQGQKVLNCNVTNKGKGVLLNTEVVLPEGKGIINRIDKELNFVEVDFVPNK